MKWSWNLMKSLKPAFSWITFCGFGKAVTKSLTHFLSVTDIFLWNVVSYLAVQDICSYYGTWSFFITLKLTILPCPRPVQSSLHPHNSYSKISYFSPPICDLICYAVSFNLNFQSNFCVQSVIISTMCITSLGHLNLLDF